MRVHDLQNGLVVRARLGRYLETKTSPEWEPWGDFRLYVQRDRKEQVCVIALPDRGDWCEYDPRHDRPYFDSPGVGLFESEGYYMEIEGLEP